MSFSREVKDELSKMLPAARHCKIAEIAAIISMCGCIRIDEFDHYTIVIDTENSAVSRKFYQLVKEGFHISPQLCVKTNGYQKRGHTYRIMIEQHEDAVEILKATKLMNSQGQLEEDLSIHNSVIIQQSCCKRAFIRGCFLATGSISDPEKGYHFEIVCTTMEKANQLKDIINSFELDAKIVERKKYYVVYLKESSMIVDVLNVMEAHISLMNLENVIIFKDVRNSVNRRVNCETANINKTVSAAVKQLEDIHYIKETTGFGRLKEGLKQVAILRLQEPEVSLRELGQMLDPPVGKSGVNHRLRKLSEIAKELREERNE